MRKAIVAVAATALPVLVVALMIQSERAVAQELPGVECDITVEDTCTTVILPPIPLPNGDTLPGDTTNLKGLRQ